MEISAVIPAYNEEENIGKTVQSLKEIKEITEVIVVDDGSQDRTYEIAEMVGAKVISLGKNLGKGEALNIGWQLAKGEIVVVLDADVKETAAEVKKLILPIMEGKADLAIASFPAAKRKGGFGIAQRFARWTIKKFTGREMVSPLSGQRAMRREVIMSTGGFLPGFAAETGNTISAHKAGYKILEIETNMSHRETGRSAKDFFHRFQQFIAVFKVWYLILWKKILEGNLKEKGMKWERRLF